MLKLKIYTILYNIRNSGFTLYRMFVIEYPAFDSYSVNMR